MLHTVLYVYRKIMLTTINTVPCPQRIRFESLRKDFPGTIRYKHTRHGSGALLEASLIVFSEVSNAWPYTVCMISLISFKFIFRRNFKLFSSRDHHLPSFCFLSRSDRSRRWGIQLKKKRTALISKENPSYWLNYFPMPIFEWTLLFGIR